MTCFAHTYLFFNAIDWLTAAGQQAKNRIEIERKRGATKSVGELSAPGPELIFVILLTLRRHDEPLFHYFL
jgi:hypothetical protein